MSNTLASHPALDAQKLVVKLFLKDGQGLPLDDFGLVFHDWIQQQSVAGHLLVDVAGYGHVKEGPGVVLVSHEANIHLDEQGGRRGLLYVRKQALPGDFARRVATVVADAYSLARKLDEAPSLAGRVRFDLDQVVFRINDRLRAPNTAETFSALEPVLTSALSAALGTRATVTHRPGEAMLFEVTATR